MTNFDKKIIKEFEKKDILTRTILLNWLRSNTKLYNKGLEKEFSNILKDFMTNILKQALAGQRDELVRMVEEIQTNDGQSRELLEGVKALILTKLKKL